MSVREGQKFGRLTVVSPATRTAKSRSARWFMRCDCGNETISNIYNLLNGHSKSCGCLQITSRLKHGYRRGGENRREYSSWYHMKDRCLNPGNMSYQYYGGRGLGVCDRWLGSFENFLSDMGPAPSPHHTLERKDNLLGYCPDNCVWATRKQQSRNTRGNRMVTFRGQTKTLIEWSEQTGIKRAVLQSRIVTWKWPVERALTEPVRRKGR